MCSQVASIRLRWHPATFDMAEKSVARAGAFACAPQARNISLDSRPCAFGSAKLQVQRVEGIVGDLRFCR
jgi:hypothetical protein